MSTRKSVKFNDEMTVSLFFLNQQTDFLLENFKAPMNEENDEAFPVPAMCDMYDLSEDEESSEEQDPPLINFVNMTEISSVDCHFFLYISKPGEYILRLTSLLHSFFKPEHLKCFHIVRPIKHTDVSSDFTISYPGVIIGVTFRETEQCKNFITSEKDLKIPEIPLIKVIPGPRGEHIWSKHQTSRSFLQGFFFVGQDPVDYRPDLLCYLASIPKGMRIEAIKREIYSHCKEYPLQVIQNPIEGKSILRLEFAQSLSVKLLVKRCMAFDGKAVLVLPCADRTPVENLYQKYQVVTTGYTNAINPKEFLRVLAEMFGPVAELNIYCEGMESLVLFQTEKAALKCAQKKEIFLKNHKIKFALASRPYRLTGKRIHKGFYNTQTPQRPLPLFPAPYMYEP
jgi:hypothetical protein